MRTSLILLAVFHILLAENVRLPKSFKRCGKNDPNFTECLKDAIWDAIGQMKNGNKELGVTPLDPIEVTEIVVNLSHREPVSGKIIFRNLKLNGITVGKLRDLTFDSENMIITTVSENPEIKIESEYEIKGRLLLLPLIGKGKCDMTLSNVKALSRIEFEPNPRRKNYVNVKDYSYNTLNMTDMKISLDNLFNGDKLLGETTNRVMNENWRELFRSVNPSFNAVLSKVCYVNTQNVFSKVPYNEIFPDKLE